MAQTITAASTPSVTTVAVQTSSTAVLSANVLRKGLILSNVGANNIYVNLSGGTAVNTNTQLSAGAMLVLLHTCPYTAITAIAATGATNLSVTELT